MARQKHRNEGVRRRDERFARTKTRDPNEIREEQRGRREASVSPNHRPNAFPHDTTKFVSGLSDDYENINNEKLRRGTLVTTTSNVSVGSKIVRPKSVVNRITGRSRNDRAERARTRFSFVRRENNSRDAVVRSTTTRNNCVHISPFWTSLYGGRYYFARSTQYYTDGGFFRTAGGEVYTTVRKFVRNMMKGGGEKHVRGRYERVCITHCITLPIWRKKATADVRNRKYKRARTHTHTSR